MGEGALSNVSKIVARTHFFVHCVFRNEPSASVYLHSTDDLHFAEKGPDKVLQKHRLKKTSPAFLARILCKQLAILKFPPVVFYQINLLWPKIQKEIMGFLASNHCECE